MLSKTSSVHKLWHSHIWGSLQMMRGRDDFCTCPPRSTGLGKLWKAHWTSEDGSVAELTCGDEYRHALSPWGKNPLLAWGSLPSSTVEFVTPLRIPVQLDSQVSHPQPFLVRARIERIPWDLGTTV